MSLTLMSMGGKQLLVYTLILKIVEYLHASFKGIEKIDNDLLIICLTNFFGPNCYSSRAIGVTKIIGALRNVVCPPGARHRKPTRLPGRKASSLRPDPNTSVMAAVRVVVDQPTHEIKNT